MGEEKTIPSSHYTVTVRVVLTDEEVEMTLPATASGKQIIDSLLSSNELDIPKTDGEGSQYIFTLSSKYSGRKINNDQTLYECGVNDGDTLLLKAKIIAG